MIKLYFNNTTVWGLFCKNHQVSFSCIQFSSCLTAGERRTFKKKWLVFSSLALCAAPVSGCVLMEADVHVSHRQFVSRTGSSLRGSAGQVSDSLLFFRRVPRADTKQEHQRLDNFSIIRWGLALSVRFCFNIEPDIVWSQHKVVLNSFKRNMGSRDITPCRS